MTDDQPQDLESSTATHTSPAAAPDSFDDQSADAAIDESHIPAAVEAILLTIDRPITTAKLAELLHLDSAKPVTAAIKSLNDFYDQHDRSFRIDQVAGGFQILTLPRFKSILAALHHTHTDNRLSPAALETLAIIAYRQPILRADIESIRGVASGEVVRSLMDKHLVKIVGRAEVIGRPMLYGTTKKFLEVFGLTSLKDLPKVEELAKPASENA